MVGEHHGGEDMKEGEHHQDEEEECEKQHIVQGPGSERESREPQPSPAISNHEGPHNNDMVAAYTQLHNNNQ